MAQRRPTANDMVQAVTLDLVANLKKVVPDLLKQEQRSFTIEYIFHIRDGVISLIEVDSWDDAFEPILLHARSEEVDSAIRKIESHLHKSLPHRLVAGTHGHVRLRITAKDNTVSFGWRTRKQWKPEWVV